MSLETDLTAQLLRHEQHTVQEETTQWGSHLSNIYFIRVDGPR